MKLDPKQLAVVAAPIAAQLAAAWCPDPKTVQPRLAHQIGMSATLIAAAVIAAAEEGTKDD